MNISREEKIKLVKEYELQSKTDQIVFIDRFFYTFDPRVKPVSKLRFRLFPFQKTLSQEVRKAVEEGYDIFVDKSRDVGATYTILATFLWFWKNVPGSNFLIGSRKEDYVDNRFGNTRGDDKSNKEESLFGKLEYMIKNLPDFLIPTGFNIDKHMGYMKLLNPENGNVIMGESANPNFSRSARFTAILFDEFAFWDNDKAAWGATADTTNCRIVLTTPGIKPGKAKRLRFKKDGEEIKIIELDYHNDPRKTKEWEKKERVRRSSEDFARELDRNWETAIKGRVYDEIINTIKGKFPYNPDWPLFASWDFGLDGTGLIWWQKNLINGKFRLVESYENRDKPIHFYLPFFGKPIDSLFTYTQDDIKLINKVKQFKKAIHYGDPDVSKRAFQDKETVSTRKVLEDNNIYVQSNTEANNFHMRREKTKVLLQTGIEMNDTENNDYWFECVSGARYPQRSENSQATSEISLPIHDWTSHLRTSTEFFAVNFDWTSYEVPETPEWALERPAWSR